MTIQVLLRGATEQLEQAGIDSARVDAELLVGHALGLSRTELYLDREAPDGELAAAQALLDRRAAREPLAYILGEWGFRRLTLKVDARVLVPRPETEVVAGRCLELIRDLPEPRVLDVGTGSGAIGLAIADEHPGARVTAVDVSEDALALARENATRTGLSVDFERRDLHDGLTGRYDLVVSNPPYVLPGEIDALEPEVRDWEPRLAIVGEEHTELVARAARDVLEPGGWLVLEVADGRAGAVLRLLGELRFEQTRVGRDLAGKDRVLEGQWAATSGRP